MKRIPGRSPRNRVSKVVYKISTVREPIFPLGMLVDNNLRVSQKMTEMLNHESERARCWRWKTFNCFRVFIHHRPIKCAPIFHIYKFSLTIMTVEPLYVGRFFQTMKEVDAYMKQLRKVLFYPLVVEKRSVASSKFHLTKTKYAN